MNYWIIKTRQIREDFANAPKRGETSKWPASRLPKNWVPGVLLFVWAASPMLQVVKLAVLVEPCIGSEGRRSLFLVRYLSDFFEGPTSSDLKAIDLFRDASFLKSGPPATVFPLTEAQGRALFEMVQHITQHPIFPPSTSKDEEADLRQKLGAGFGSPEENKRVEQAAIREATTYLEREGWHVRSVEAEKRGYDLHCRREGKELLVEVKGVRGQLPQFILTAGEYRLSQENPLFALCVVTSVLQKAEVSLISHHELIDRLRVVPFAFKAELAK